MSSAGAELSNDPGERAGYSLFSTHSALAAALDLRSLMARAFL